MKSSPHTRSIPALSRRHFLRSLPLAATGLAVPNLLTAPLLGADAPSNRIRVGTIGVGSRGSGHTRALMGYPGVDVVAVCDAYQSKADRLQDTIAKHYASTRKRGSYGKCLSTTDFRELLAVDGLDAVVIASPENWHGVQMAEAAKAGIDVYGEKSLTHTIPEGRALVDTVRRHGCVFQAGTQQRSDAKFRIACELARNGYLGKVHTVHVGVPGGNGRAAPGSWAVEKPPADLNYDLWLGPAAWKPYRKGLCSFQWYFVSDYCVGWIASWGVHHMDIAMWGQPQLHTGKVEIDGTASFFNGSADVSHSWDVSVTTAKGPRLHFVDNTKGHGQGCRFIGDKGWVHVNRGSIKASDPALLRIALKPADTRLQVSTNHHADFLEGVRTRRDPVATVEACHRATALTVAADIATRVGRKVVWDWDTEQFVNDDIANRMLTRSLRAPWRI